MNVRGIGLHFFAAARRLDGAKPRRAAEREPILAGTINAPFAFMALREFTDDDGRAWQVWDITPDKMHPSTRAEDYLQDVLDGWLVFAATDGHGKARLHPIPGMWAEADEAELRSMLRRADPVREMPDRKSGPTHIAAPEGSGSSAGPWVGDREVGHPGSPSIEVRTFRYPAGRVWSVAEQMAGEQSSAESRVVLRFSSGSRILDLNAFPRDWVSYSNEQLIDLLCTAFPRPTDHEQRDTAHHRRRDDTRRS